MLSTGNPEYPPYLWRDPDDENRLIGANADFVQAIGKEIGIPVEVRYLGPWGRVQEEAKLGRVDLLAGAFLTLPRFDYMDYVYPAFRETSTVIWVRKGGKVRYKKWSDLTGKSGVTVINNSFGEEFDRYAKESLRISTVATLEQALAILNLGRADYLIYEETPGLAIAAKNQITSLQAVYPAITNENLYLTVPHKSPCNTADIRSRLAKAMYKLDKQKVMDKLLETNMELWRKQHAK
ncbi:transporter substrate-binding domain-containing protein [Undibacterium sp. CY7W]|uniref:Transporter substrate-binding domain-containing protein n=1 Tax=Undibacterium rugosum TaxID=2762291 RepID=A0A923I1S1_9BURK|nr:transporter substrate-binding domain-containing protein [Undibacterium rugosum]